MHICDKSVALSALWPHDHVFSFFFFFFFFTEQNHVSFLALTDQTDRLCQSYCDRVLLGEVPDFSAINHAEDKSEIHTCSTAGALVAQFLVPFAVNRQKFHVACVSVYVCMHVCVCMETYR